MGHPRRAEAAPSPVQLLAIFSAKENGVPLPDIARRTKYSVSSIMRWWDKWGSDTAFYESVNCEMPELLNGHTFDVLFPDLERQSTFELGGPQMPGPTLGVAVPELTESVPELGADGNP